MRAVGRGRRSEIGDLCLFVDRVDPEAQVDDMLVTLLPGETRRFTVATVNRPDPPAWIDAITPAAGESLVARAFGDRG